MANFRRSHGGDGRRSSGSMRMLLYTVVLAIVLFFLFFWFQSRVPSSEGQVEINNEPPNYAPNGNDGKLLLRNNFALSYNKDTRQADWAAYVLSREMLNSKKIEGRKDFARDKETGWNAPGPKDYSHSGYTRGHLVPSADMSFSEISMKQTYLMSNISPQLHSFNGGIWRELEEHTRDWARKYIKVYVITGPVFGRHSKSIGESGIKIPKSFYKVIMDIDDPEVKGIGFIIPNEKSDVPLQNFAVTIDSVEATTGIDFFAEVVRNSRLEHRIESNVNLKKWTFNEKWYQLRINHWNK